MTSSDLSRDARRIMLVILDHAVDVPAGRCSCGYRCDPDARVAMATHLALEILDEPGSDEQPLSPPTCGVCGRERTLADAYDYNPLQVVTGRPLGWYSAEDGEFCPACMERLIRSQPTTRGDVV